jgi:hypothetical protein
MAGPLHVHHDHYLNEMADMQAVRSGVKADIKCNRFLSQQLPDLFFMGCLCQVTPFLQYVINIRTAHLYSSIQSIMVFILPF